MPTLVACRLAMHRVRPGPDISPAYADLQIARSEATVRALVEKHTDGRDLGVLAEPGVNVLRLNLAGRR